MGIYDINRNEGFVNLGVFHDTREFAVEKYFYDGGKLLEETRILRP
jgi:hypothetical protein